MYVDVGVQVAGDEPYKRDTEAIPTVAVNDEKRTNDTAPALHLTNHYLVVWSCLCRVDVHDCRSGRSLFGKDAAFRTILRLVLTGKPSLYIVKTFADSQGQKTALHHSHPDDLWDNEKPIFSQH